MGNLLSVVATFPDDGYVTDDEIAKFIGVSTQTVRNWVRQGKLPEPKKFSPRCTRWDAAKVREILKNEEISN